MTTTLYQLLTMTYDRVMRNE